MMHTAEGTVEGFNFFNRADFKVIHISFVPKNLKTCFLLSVRQSISTRALQLGRLPYGLTNTPILLILLALCFFQWEFPPLTTPAFLKHV